MDEKEASPNSKRTKGLLIDFSLTMENPRIQQNDNFKLPKEYSKNIKIYTQ